jgi:hypothetical protein
MYLYSDSPRSDLGRWLIQQAKHCKEVKLPIDSTIISLYCLFITTSYPLAVEPKTEPFNHSIEIREVIAIII